jgi:hypothetical protein
MVTNPALVVAVHEQAAGILMAKLPLPPVMGNVWAKGAIVNAHAVVEEVRFMLQLPATLPGLPPVSSTT